MVSLLSVSDAIDASALLDEFAVRHWHRFDHDAQQCCQSVFNQTSFINHESAQ
jgi:hypothetical protein